MSVHASAQHAARRRQEHRRPHHFTRVQHHLPRVELFGYPFVAASSEREVAAAVLNGSALSERVGSYPLLTTPNTDILVTLDKPEHAELAQRAQRSAYLLPDGAPVVWSSRLLGRHLPARLTGSGLFAELWPRIHGTDGVVLVGPSDDVATLLGGDDERTRIITAPIFDAHDSETVEHLTARVAAACAEVNARFVFIALSFLKSFVLSHRVIEQVGVGREGGPELVLIVGAGAEMYVGLERRAPEWMQRAGLEWLFRFGGNPRRLFRRYFVEDPRFLYLVARERRRRNGNGQRRRR